MFRVAGPAQFWLKMTNIPILHLKHKDLDSVNVSGMFAFEKFFSSHGPSLRRKTGHIKFSRKVDGGKGWGQNAKLGPHSVIWGKLGTALQAYALNPCTKFPPNPTSRKVNT